MKTLISNLRAYLQLSQAGFAAPLGLSPAHIARFEKGVSIPSPETIDKICKVFCVDRRYFEGSIYTPDTPDTLDDHTSNEGSSPDDHSVDESSENRVQMSVESAVKKMNPEEGIAERLKSARKERGWSQNELAKQSSVDRTVISRIESGATLTEKQAVKLAETLEVGIEWLLKGDEEKKDYPIDQRMIDWLWGNEEIRHEIWTRMCQAEQER